jgi:hypothetical protein
MGGGLEVPQKNLNTRRCSKRVYTISETDILWPASQHRKKSKHTHTHTHTCKGRVYSGKIRSRREWGLDKTISH